MAVKVLSKIYCLISTVFYFLKNITMQNLRAMLVAIFVAAFLLTSNAQGIGLRGGVNFQNINGKDFFGDKLENTLVPGFNAGIIAELPIVPDYFFQTGVLYSTKGAKSEDSFLGQQLTNQVMLGYLEVPVHFLHKPLLGNGHLILGLGPYIGYALHGKVTLEVAGKDEDFNITFQKKVGPSDSEDEFYFRRFDAGANLFAGYEFASGLSFQLNTQLGLLNINPDYEDENNESKWNNTGFGLSLGYRFGQ